MGSTTQHIDDATNLSGLGVKSALGYALPPIIPFRNIVRVLDKAGDKITNPAVEAEAQKVLANLGQEFFQCKVSFELDGVKWDLPVDPVVAVNGKNVITRRYVSKFEKRGSIKECWSQDDFEITIGGVLIGLDNDELKTQISRLREICEAKESVKIICDYLNNEDTFNINYIAIESYDFPFTKGMENQVFSIKAYSDDGYSLLEEA